MAGGFGISLIFARGTTQLQSILKAEGYNKKKGWQKTGDVVLTKFILAPLKTFVVVNILPFSVRVVSEQAWDYLMTIFAAYLMNRKESLFLKGQRQNSRVKPDSGNSVSSPVDSKSPVDSGSMDALVRIIQQRCGSQVQSYTDEIVAGLKHFRAKFLEPVYKAVWLRVGLHPHVPDQLQASILAYLQG